MKQSTLLTKNDHSPNFLKDEKKPIFEHLPTAAFCFLSVLKIHTLRLIYASELTVQLHRAFSHSTVLPVEAPDCQKVVLGNFSNQGKHMN